ncbi:hypothetical protein [Nonomuraea sp. NPDC049695]|uniref:hypothetical protein n=1 Tax=Nonomuraea sp. NPDC049695 TaxID=3154734 RepID=UPI00342AA518
MKKIAAALACLGVLTACTAEPRATPPPPGPMLEEFTLSQRWEQVKIDATAGTALVDMTATGPRDAWAVGLYASAEDEPGYFVLKHWDGSRWRAVSALRRFTDEEFSSGAAVDADGPRNVWVAGDDENGPCTLQWNGRRWLERRVPGDGWVDDIAVDGKRVVLIGARSRAEGTVPYTSSWDGSRFVNETFEGKFTAVVAGAGHTWIAGEHANLPAVWHRPPGGRLERMAVPAVPGGSLADIWQNGPDDVLAVGTIAGPKDENATYGARPLILRWDGTAWRRTELPDWHGELQAVTALGKDDVWAAGVDVELQPGRVMMLHYDGRSWTREFLRSAGMVNKLSLTRVPGTSQLWLTDAREVGEGDEPVVFRRP